MSHIQVKLQLTLILAHLLLTINLYHNIIIEYQLRPPYVPM